jgi:hypothetical protein
VASVAQVPATVTVAGQGERGATVPPRLYGTVEAEPAAPATLTAARLSLAPATAEDPAYLTFLVTADSLAAAADLPMTVTYRPRLLEHATGPLRVALADDVLDLALPAVDAPAPVREVPPAPALREQTATQSESGGSVFGWDHTVDLTLYDTAAQDALWLDVTYHLPLAAPVLLADGDPVTDLYEALAAFTTAWPLLAPGVEAFAAAQEGGPPGATALLGAVWEQVRGVAEAWAALRGIDVPWLPASLADEAAVEDEAVAAETDHYVVGLAGMADGVLDVRARAGTADDPATIRWPTIAAGGAATPPGTVTAAGDDWYAAAYEVGTAEPGRSLPLTFVWPGLDARERQTATARCHVVRNAALSSADPPPAVNPAFRYRTVDATFASPVVALLVVPPLPVTPAGTTLAATLATALADVARAATAEADRFVRVEVAYSYPFDPETPDVRASVPVLLVEDIRLTPGDAPPGGGAVTLAAFAASLAQRCDAWFAMAAPGTTDALLDLGVVVAADAEGDPLPVLRFTSIPVEVPDGWWS